MKLKLEHALTNHQGETMANNELPEIDIAFIRTNETTPNKDGIRLRFFGLEADINIQLDKDTGYKAEVENYYGDWPIDEISNFSNWLMDQANLKKLDEEVNYTDLRAPGTTQTKYKQTVRTNYFAVKSFQAFEHELAEVCSNHLQGESFRIVRKDRLGVETCAVLFFTDAHWVFDEDEYKWSEFFGRHLKDDWVAIVMQVGAAGYEYLHATATAYNNKGEMETVDLSNIEDLAKRLGKQVTETRF